MLISHNLFHNQGDSVVASIKAILSTLQSRLYPKVFPLEKHPLILLLNYAFFMTSTILSIRSRKLSSYMKDLLNLRMRIRVFWNRRLVIAWWTEATLYYIWDSVYGRHQWNGAWVLKLGLDHWFFFKKWHPTFIFKVLR